MFRTRRRGRVRALAEFFRHRFALRSSSRAEASVSRPSRSTSSTAPRKPVLRQLTFSRRGGVRRGAGRKPKGAKALVSHATRPALAARFPVLVTLKLARGLPSLRRANEREPLLRSLAAA